MSQGSPSPNRRRIWGRSKTCVIRKACLSRKVRSVPQKAAIHRADAGSGDWGVDAASAGDFIDTAVEPQEAATLLTLTAVTTRAILAQVCALHFAREDPPPPLSLPYSMLYLVKPLLEAGWLERCDDEQQHFNGEMWGEVPEGMVAVALSWRGIGAILALLSGAPETGSEWLGRNPAALRRLPDYSTSSLSRRFRVHSGSRWRIVVIPSEHSPKTV